MRKKAKNFHGYLSDIRLKDGKFEALFHVPYPNGKYFNMVCDHDGLLKSIAVTLRYDPTEILDLDFSVIKDRLKSSPPKAWMIRKDSAYKRPYLRYLGSELVPNGIKFDPSRSMWESKPTEASNDEILKFLVGKFPKINELLSTIVVYETLLDINARTHLPIALSGALKPYLSVIYKLHDNDRLAVDSGLLCEVSGWTQDNLRDAIGKVLGIQTTKKHVDRDPGIPSLQDIVDDA